MLLSYHVSSSSIPLFFNKDILFDDNKSHPSSLRLNGHFVKNNNELFSYFVVIYGAVLGFIWSMV